MPENQVVPGSGPTVGAPTAASTAAAAQLARGATLTAQTLTVAVVARRLGVAPATLRTWARRYDLGPSQHTAGSHRRYTAEDFARLVVMRRLTHEGTSPGEAAQVALKTPAESLGQVGQADVAFLPSASGSARDLEPGTAAYPSAGRVVSLEEARRIARGLNRAAMTLDGRGVAELIQRQISLGGVVSTWDDVVRPVLANIGRRWEQTGEGVEVEHQFAEAARATFTVVSSRLSRPRNTAQVLLSCTEDEQHSLPLYAMAAALAERGVFAGVLGARVPIEALASAVRRTGAVVILIHASMPVEPGVLDDVLRRTRPNARLLLGGPGWGAATLPPYAEAVGSLAAAVDRVCDIVAD
jgi:MerR family transcriptional regulator, light-induced transcriptional regulator